MFMIVAIHKNNIDFYCTHKRRRQTKILMRMKDCINQEKTNNKLVNKVERGIEWQRRDEKQETNVFETNSSQDLFEKIRTEVFINCQKNHLHKTEKAQRK